MILNARRIEPQGGTYTILLSIEDIATKKSKSEDNLKRWIATR
jgi:hypothetical protein